MPSRTWTQPGFWPELLIASILLIVTLCTIPNHELACVLNVLGMPVLVPAVVHRRGRRESHIFSLTMIAMVGGTAGGLLGGICVRLLCAPSAMDPIMMASMAGMVGGTLCGLFRSRNGCRVMLNALQALH